MKNYLLRLLLLALSLAAAACTRQPVKFDSAAGRFSVMTPVELTETTKHTDSELGDIVIHFFSGNGSTHGFAATYGDMPIKEESSSAAATLDLIRDKSFTAIQARLVSEKPVTVQGHPGREVFGTGKNDGHDVDIDERIILAGHREYQFIVTAPSGKMNQTAADAYLQSIDISPPPPVISPAQPVDFKSEAGRFSITTPVTLTETTKIIKGAAGSVAVHFFCGGEDGPVFLAAYIDRPAGATGDPAVFIRRLIDSVVAGDSGQLQSIQNVTLDSFPGSDFSYSGKKGGVAYSAHGRIYLAGNRVYQVQATSTDRPLGPDADAFLKSLKLLPAVN